MTGPWSRCWGSLLAILGLTGGVKGGQLSLTANVVGAFHADFSPAPLGDLSGVQPGSLIYQIDFSVVAHTSPGEREFGATAFNVDLQGLSPVPGLGWSPASSALDFPINGDLGPSSSDLNGIVVAKSIISPPARSAVASASPPASIVLGSLFVEWDGQSHAALSWGDVEGSFILDDGKFGRARTYAGGSFIFGSSLVPDLPPQVEPPIELPPVIEPPAEEPPPLVPQLPPPPPDEAPSLETPEEPPLDLPTPVDPGDPTDITTFPYPQLELRHWIDMEEVVLDTTLWQGGALFLYGGTFSGGETFHEPMLFHRGVFGGDVATTNAVFGNSLLFDQSGVSHSSADAPAAVVPEPSTLVLSLLVILSLGAVVSHYV